MRLLLLLVAALLAGCAGCAACPRPDAIRPDLHAKDESSAHLELQLRANVVAQTNERPARLLLSWNEPVMLDLVVKDATEKVRLHRTVEARDAKTAADPVAVLLTEEDGQPLPPGVYRVEATSPAALGERATASFEVCHCTVYY